MDLEYVLCPFCGADAYREIYKEQGALGIVQCCRCGINRLRLNRIGYLASNIIAIAKKI